MSENYPDGRYKMVNPHDKSGNNWTIEQVIDGKLRGPYTPIQEWVEMGYLFELVVILTVKEYEKLNNSCNCDCSPCIYCDKNLDV